MSIEAFIFDLDGVITNTANYHYYAWRALAQSLGIVIDEEFNETLKGISRAESLNRILIYGKRQTEFNQAEKQELMSKKNDLYRKMILQIDESNIYTGIRDLLVEIKENNIKLGLASASENGGIVIERLGLFSFFDAIVSPTLVKEGKPSPEIFLKAAEMLKANPKRCVGIEDAQAGIEAINRAEMFSVGVGKKGDLVGADLLVPNPSLLKFKEIKECYENY